MNRLCWPALTASLLLAGCTPPRPSPTPAPPTVAPQTAQPPRSPAPPAPNTTPPDANPPRQDPAPPPANPAPPPPQPGPSPEDAKAKKRRSLFGGKFVKFTETTVSNQPFYTIEVDLKNDTGKDVKLAQGGVWFYDESGKDIHLLGDTFGPVKAGETARRGYNPLTLDATAVAYMKAHPDEVKVEFEAGKIEYADGSKVDFDRPHK